MVYTGPERREFVRVTLSLPVRYRPLGTQQEYIESHSEDISTGGVKLILKGELRAGAPLELELELLKEDKTIVVSLEASVVWVKPVPDNLEYPYKAGIKFINLNINDSMLISNCIYFRAELLKKPFR